MAKRSKGAAAVEQPPTAFQPQVHAISVEHAMSVAYSHWNAGQTDQAEQLCRQVLAAWPGHSDALHLLGVMAHAWGNEDAAIEYLRQACMAPRVPALFHSNLAEMLRRKGRLEEAVAAGRRAVAAESTLAAAWNNLGIALQENGELEESLHCLERTVALQGDYAEAHSNLGNTLKKLGRLDQACARYARALELNPNHAEAHSNLSAVLNELGRRDEAADHARRAIDLAPRLVDAYLNLAAIESNRGNHEEALRRLEATLAFAPDRAGTAQARAAALKNLDRLDEALDVIQRAVVLHRDDGEIRCAQGMILQAMGRSEEALAIFDDAAELLMPKPGMALSNKATLLLELGRREEALAVFDQAAKAEPDLASVWFNRADAYKFTPGDPDIERMAALLESGKVQSFDDRTSLSFALAKACMDVGQDERAFAYLADGNALKRSTFDYDAAGVDAWLRSIADHFSADLMGRHAGKGALSAAPIFVLGMPRSGTTLVEQILASHPRITGAGELNYMQNLVRRVYAADGSLQSYPDYAGSMQGPDWRRMGEAYLARVAPLALRTPRVVDKMPANFLYAGLIHLALPQAKIVHVRRDAVDTCLSCYTKLFAAEQMFAYDLAELGRFYRGYEALMAHWRRVLPAESFHEVEYEALVGDLEGEARRLLEFCGEAWDESCARPHETDRPIRTASLNQVRQPVYATSIGRWKRYGAQLGPLLAALGVEA